MNLTELYLTKNHILSLLQSGKSGEARTLCTDLCQHNQTDPDSWFLLAAINAQLGQYEETISACRKVLSLDPRHEGARFNLGVALQVTGKLDQAAVAYQVLANQRPAHAGAYNNLAQVLRKQGKFDEAIHWLQTAIEIEPGRTDILNNLGLSYIDQGNLINAAATFEIILALSPDNAESLSNLGLVRHMQSRPAEATQCLEMALDTNPDFAVAHNTLANILLSTGHGPGAVKHFRHAVDLDPGNAEFHYNLAHAYQVLREQQLAIQEYRIALERNPQYTEAWNNLGQCLLSQNSMAQAIDCFRNALLLQPDNAALHHNLSSALWRTGNPNEALEQAFQAVVHNTKNRMFRQNFSQISGMSTQFPIDQRFEKELENSLSVQGIDHQLLLTASLSVLAHKKRFSELLQMPVQNSLEKGMTKWAIKGDLTEILHNKLFQRILIETVVADVRFERLLKSLRRIFIGLVSEKQEHPPSELINKETDFMCALACQCFNNEYIYLTDDNEQQSADKLIESVGKRLKNSATPQGRLLSELIIASMYTPLYRIKNHESLLELDLSHLKESVQTLFKRQLFEPIIDLSLSKQIETITPIDNQVSQAVRDQYEGLPYPRWLDVNLHEPRAVADVFSSMFFHFTPSNSISNSPRILIAGCGSGRHAIITATRFANAEVLAIDLSKNSLAYAKRMANRLGIENIRFSQADILKLGTVNEQFDIIESVGVLHHMEDPLKGLRILLELLRPSGLINLGFYSKLARRSIIAAQDFFQKRGYSTSQDDLRKARDEILALDTSEPLYSITSMQDFYSLSEFCDLAFHAQEICYTLPEVARMLEQAKLQFIGFEFTDPSIKQHYKELFPKDKKLSNLSNWSSFEQRFPDTFIEMYTFWSQKAGLS